MVTTFRIDDTERDGFKKIVCGACVPEEQANDPRRSASHFLCEACGENFGKIEAVERGNRIYAKYF